MFVVLVISFFKLQVFVVTIISFTRALGESRRAFAGKIA